MTTKETAVRQEGRYSLIHLLNRSTPSGVSGVRGAVLSIGPPKSMIIFSREMFLKEVLLTYANLSVDLEGLPFSRAGLHIFSDLDVLQEYSRLNKIYDDTVTGLLAKLSACEQEEGQKEFTETIQDRLRVNKRKRDANLAPLQGIIDSGYVVVESVTRRRQKGQPRGIDATVMPTREEMRQLAPLFLGIANILPELKPPFREVEYYKRMIRTYFAADAQT